MLTAITFEVSTMAEGEFRNPTDDQIKQVYKDIEDHRAESAKQMMQAAGACFLDEVMPKLHKLGYFERDIVQMESGKERHTLKQYEMSGLYNPIASVILDPCEKKKF